MPIKTTEEEFGLLQELRVRLTQKEMKLKDFAKQYGLDVSMFYQQVSGHLTVKPETINAVKKFLGKE